MGEEPDLAAITVALGTRWESAHNTYKPYPCGIVLHPAIDALLELRATHALRADAVDAVVVRGNPLLAQRTDRPAPRSGREAAVSAQHTAAVCLLDGAASVAQYSDARATDPAVLSLGARVTVEQDAAIPVGAAVVSVRTRDGRTVTHSVAHALGSRERPMSDAALEAKVRELAAFGAPGCDVERLIDAAWTLDRSDDAAAVARLAGART
jgi:2-methylcitrate dehydratase PrpD